MLDDKLIGLLGGAFDPIHNAHISIAEECIKKIGLKKIIFIPTGSSANKKLTNYNHRLEMVSLVCNNPNFQVSDFEIKKYLNSVEYITIDCGFERGVKQESTIAECSNYLIKNNFKMINFGAPRIVTLFKNLDI